MVTPRDIIMASLRLIGAIASGETPTAAEISDGLSALNLMIDSLSADGFHIFEEKREEFNLSPSQQTYTMGPGGDFDTVRPQVINTAKVRYSDDELALDIYNQEKWAAIGVKNLESTIPQVLYYNANYPLGEVSLWPIPSAAHKIVIYSLKPLTMFSDVNADVELPPGYLEALKFNLAVRIAPEYSRPIPDTVFALAESTLAAVKRTNVKPVYMRNEVTDVIYRKPFNWLTGE